MAKLVRLKSPTSRQSPDGLDRDLQNHQHYLQNYRYDGVNYAPGGWYKVSDEVAEHLARVPSQFFGEGPFPSAFEVCTEEEKSVIEASDKKAKIEAEYARIQGIEAGAPVMDMTTEDFKGDKAKKPKRGQ